MATALHLSDSSRSTGTHKLLTQKKRPQGFQAPRNSLDFPSESYQGYHEIYENIPFSCIIKNPSRLSIIPSGTPVKKLIDEEMSSKVNSRCRAPSVVARLMGMDSLPPETSISSNERLTANLRNSEQRHGLCESGSSWYQPYNLGPFGRQGDEFLLSKHVNAVAATVFPSRGKPHRREHPQEEQLQKFKKEFEEWQSNMKWEQNKNDRFDGSPLGWKEHPTFPKGKIGEDKMMSSVNSQHTFSYQKASRLSDSDNRIQRVEFYDDIGTIKYPSNLVKPASENRMQWINARGFHAEENIQILDEPPPTANIVILKPNAEYIDDFRETWANSPEIVEKVGSIEHFLEEVKERLRLEVQGRPIPDVVTQGSIEGPLRKGRFTDPKKIAQHIARQIRESISRDIEIALTRSKSTRPSNNEECCSLANSSISTSKETQKTFLKRLRNARNIVEGNLFSVDSNGGRNGQISAKKVIRPISTSECSPVNDFGLSNTNSQLKERSTSFRLEHEKDAAFSKQPSSLSRSYSAPASGTAYGKRLSENRHIPADVHIHREHGSDGNVSETMRKKLIDGFNFKNKVSNLRHNLTLKHKLFNKKLPLEEQLTATKSDSEGMTSASLLMNVGTAKDNLTEVPPSPVSISSGSPDDFFKHASPVSPLDIPFNKEHSSPQISEGVASCISDQSPSRLIDDVASEVLSSHVQTPEDKGVETYSHEETFIQEVLLTAGFYQRDLSSVTSPRGDMLSAPVPSWVFEEVEKAYHNPNMIEGCSTEETSVSHKLLFDLLNEALAIVLKPRNRKTALKWSRSLYRKIPRGKNLLHALWHEMSNLTPYFAEPYLIEDLMAHDISRGSWSVMVEEERDAVGDDIASLILEQLLDSLLN